MRVEGQGMAVVKNDAVTKAVNKNEAPVEKQFQATGEQTSGKKVTLDELNQAIKTANEAMIISSYHLEFKLLDDHGDYQVSVIDDQTKDVIKKIPPDYMVNLSKRLKDAINKEMGILVDELA
jgi:flagellar protein FlaG